MANLNALTLGSFLAAAAALGLAGPAQAVGGGCVVFTDKGAFEQFNAADGKFLKGVEDFEESNIPDGAKVVLTAPLQGNVPNLSADGFGFPLGLLQKNIIIQDNITPGPNPPTVNPSGSPFALYVIGPGFAGSNSKKVGEDLEVLTGQEASLDLIFTEPNHTGIGFDLSFFPGFGGTLWHITIYDKNEIEIGKFIWPAAVEPDKTFFGIWCEHTIGRINIWDEGIVPDAIDDIQMWEEPVQVPTCPWDCGIPHNKVVDVIDLLLLLAQWDIGSPFICDGGTCDFNGDGCVDVIDLLKLLAQWGQACPPPVNDDCTGKIFIDRIDPDGTVVEHFDMYGATPSPEPYKCFDIVPQKDIWYCLINATNVIKGVTLSSTVNLLIEVNAGCTCPPGPLVACGTGPGGTPQFTLLPGEAVNIRLVNAFNLPNDLLKGDLIIDNKTIVPPACSAARIDFGVTLDDFASPNACPGPIPITTQYQISQSIVFGTAVDNFGPPPVVIIDDGACFPSCRSAGTPVYTGPWWCQFRIAAGPADIPAGVTSFSAELCFIDAPGPIIMEGYNNARVLIASAGTTVAGSEVVSITAPAGELIAYVHIGNTIRPAGVSVDCLSYPDPIPREPIDEVNFFTDPALFFEALQNANKTEKFFWDFKPDFLPVGTVVKIASPLDIFTHPFNAPGVWFGFAGDLWPPEVDNVQFWGNAIPQGPFTPGPNLEYHKTSNNALVAQQVGALQTSFEILSGPPAGDNHTAFALELVSIGPLPPVFHVSVYDKNDFEIGKFAVTAGPAPCPFDLNGDGVVDNADVVILQGLFGIPCPPPCPPCLGDVTGDCLRNLADLSLLIANFGPCPVQDKVFLGLISKDNDITIGRIDIWDVNGGEEGISSIAAYFRPVNPFGCPGPGNCCVPHGTPACDNEDCCRRVCAIDAFCCTTAWDQICANHATQFPQCGCVPGPTHTLQPCPPGGCPPAPAPLWCLYEVQAIVQDPDGACEFYGIVPGQVFCVTPCPFPTDPVACMPNAPDPSVNFGVVGTGCVFNCVALDGCEPCPAAAKQWQRIN